MTKNEIIEGLLFLKSKLFNGIYKDRLKCIDEAIARIEESEKYFKLQERLEAVYGKCDGLLEVVVSGLEKHENAEFPDHIFKSRLLIDEDVDKWDVYKKMHEDS